MKPFSRALIPLLLVAFGGVVSARADDETDVLAANTQVELAFTKLDVKAIEATWAQDGSVSVIHPASKAPILGWEAVQKSYADHPVRYKDFSVVMDKPQVTIKGNIAWVVGIEKVYAHRANGDVLDISALATNIFEKRSSKWLLVHHHASRMP
jgi:ketosteroid isomerase-like protein